MLSSNSGPPPPGFPHAFNASLPVQIDLAPHVGASLDVMERDSKAMRGDGPTVFTSVREGKGVEHVINLVLAAWRQAGSPGQPGAVGDVA